MSGPPCMPKGYEVSSVKGPCEDDGCKSAGCRSARLLARTPCSRCGVPVGWDNPVLFEHTFDSENLLVVRHERCEDAASRGKPHRT